MADARRRTRRLLASAGAAILASLLWSGSVRAQARAVCLTEFTPSDSGAVPTGNGALACGTEAKADGDGAAAVGNAGFNAGKLSKCDGNVAIGQLAGNTVNGSGNVGIGRSGGELVTVDRNVGVGGRVGAGVTASDTALIGTNAKAVFRDSTAIGKDATTTRDDQQMFGAASNTNTMAGLTSGASKALHGAPIPRHHQRLPAGWPVALLLAALGVILYLGARRYFADPGHRGETLNAPPAAGQSATQDGGPLRPDRGHEASELRGALRSCRSAFIGTAAFSFIINVLMLTGAVFMLEVYDRVLPSRSVPTLVAMCVIAGILFTALGLLDVLRGRLLARAGGAIDESLAARVFDVVVRLPIKTGNSRDGLQPVRDLDAIRSFLSSQGPTALFDLPWLPLYLAIVYAFHPLLGVTALVGAVILVSLTVLTEALARQPTRKATAHSMARIYLAQACLRNAEVLAGMGFASRLGSLWADSNERALAWQRRAGDIAGGLGAIARVLRMALQSAVLATGAYLVIMQQASAGIIIAGSILSARALAPVDIAIANWRAFIAARQSWARLGQLLAKLPRRPTPMPLPAPSSKLQVEGLVVVPPGEQRPVIRDVGFALNPGQGLGIVGPSGAGKSSLARVLVGAWLPAAGRVRLDGAALDQWAPDALGQHVGYLPQGVELFAGNVARNIARFDPDASSEAVIAAAKAADVHDLIVSLPSGYDTEIGEAGGTLSAGQRQRVALARALYGDPFLVVLDEPDASLDQDGEIALHKAILGVRSRGGIVVVVSHRQAVLGAVDLLLAMERGRPVAAGPKELVLQKVARHVGRAVHALK